MSRGDGLDPRMRARRAEVDQARRRRRRRSLLGVVGVIVVLAGFLAVLHSPIFSARHVVVIGAGETPAGAIIAAAGLVGHPPLVDVNPAEAASRVEALPWVGTAIVKRHWPDSVTVDVTERAAVALVPSSGGGGYLVDRTGRILAVTRHPPASLPSLHVPVAPGRPGSWLASPSGAGLDVIVNLTPALSGWVRSVDVSAAGQVDLDLTGKLFAVVGPPTEVRAKLEALASVLASGLSGPATVDVRVPQEPTVTPGLPAGAAG